MDVPAKAIVSDVLRDRAGTSNGRCPLIFDQDMKFDCHINIAALAADGRGAALDC